MILVTVNDFKGKFALARTTDTDIVLLDYINTYEEKYIYDLLGVELGKLLIAEIQFETGSGSDGLDTRFEDIVRPFAVQDATSQFVDWYTQQARIFKSMGLKQMLIGLIYFHYVHETQVQHTQGGVALYMAESGAILSPRTAIRLAERKWNAQQDTIDAIQYRCKYEKPLVYPEFKGVEIPTQNNSMI